MNNNYNSCVEGCDIPSTPNDLKILVKHLKREVDELVKNTEAKLLIHDGKIAELCKYLKDNLSNTIRCLIDSMQLSGELDNILVDALNDIILDTVGIRFKPLTGIENASYNTREFNSLVNNLLTKLINSNNSDQKVKWSIPTINITIPAGEYYFDSMDIVQGLNLKGAGKNVTIIHLLNPAKIKYVYQQTLANGVGNITIKDIFFYGNHEKSINCFEPAYNENTGRYAHLIYSTIYNCSFYGFNEVFKILGYNNSIYNNTFNWCNRCMMIYGYDGVKAVGGDWNIYSNSANNIKEFITSTFSSLIHAHDNWAYQGLGSYINLLGWNRGSVIENNRLEDTTTPITIHGGSIVSYYGEVYQKISNTAGSIKDSTWNKLTGFDSKFIEPYEEGNSYNILQAIAIMVRNNNFHTCKNEAIILNGGQYITIQDNYSGNYVKLSTNISDCQGLKYHNNMNIEYTPNFYDDYRDWKAINSFNLQRSFSVGTPENFMNISYATSSPHGINFRINDKINAFKVLNNGGVYLMNNAKVVQLATGSNSTKVTMDCINTQTVVIFPRNKATAEWYSNNIANVYAECGNGNIAITHPNTSETLTFNVIVI